MNLTHASRSYIYTLALKRPEVILKAALCMFTLEVSSPLEELVAVLHPGELVYFNELEFDRRKRSYLIGRYAAKQAIANLVQKENLQNILIQQGIFNQPVVRCEMHQNIQVSITHCEEFGAAIAFPEAHPMGIDLQEINERRREVIESQVSEPEKEIIGKLSHPYDTILTLFWTAKEALSKVLKTGMMTPFTLFEMNVIEVRDDCFIGYFKNFAQYKTLSFVIDKHVCSIVYPKNTELGIDLSSVVSEISQIK